MLTTNVAKRKLMINKTLRLVFGQLFAKQLKERTRGHMSEMASHVMNIAVLTYRK